jgi:hypothetical protein
MAHRAMDTGGARSFVAEVTMDRPIGW